MGKVLYLTTAQVAYLVGIEPKAVTRRTRAKPGEIPLIALDVPGITGTCFEATNVAEVWPEAVAALVAAFGK